MKTALNVATVSQDLSFEDFVQVTGEAGFDGIELIVPNQMMDYAMEKGVDGVKALLDDAGVQLSHFFPGLPVMASREAFEEAIEPTREKLEVAAELGMEHVGVWIPPYTDRPVSEARADLAARVRDAAQLVGEHDLSLTVEFIGTMREQPMVVSTLADVLEIIEVAGESNVAAVVDLFHFYTGESDMADLRAMPLELLGIIHMNDAPAGDAQRLKDADRVLPGQGVIPVVEMLRICVEKGYDGWLSLELFGEPLRQMDPRKAAEMGHKAIDRVLEETTA